MWIMVSGPYRSGAPTPEQRKTNLVALNVAAVGVWRRGHVPIIGVNLALPIIEAAGDGSYDEIMIPVSLSLCDRCDAVLRIEGGSTGADDEVQRFRAAGKPVFSSIGEVPILRRVADHHASAEQGERRSVT